ncbi:proteic killer suppression protein [Abditibacterium utsteinense]|uniref:Proteic killer suppression protein n=1 Tax=Abditibacterium utsteinense TaxID=1960156 RepID=A0A2S8STC7_9BACT|nr:plasmid maintenance system killer [Abditibacterium utsteinense]PQV64050.1 proteic killer suppression protein [Abditibacterium utsteinense]
MIEKFRSKALKVAMAGDVSKLVPQVARRILGVLAVLDAAESLEDVQPLTGFHALQSDREGEFAVTITRNWRITFTPISVKNEEGETEFHVTRVDYEDYH